MGTVPKGPSAAPHGQTAVSAYLAAWLRRAKPATSGMYTVTVDRFDAVNASSPQIRAAREVASTSYTVPVVPVVRSTLVPWVAGLGLAVLALLALLWLATHRRRRR